MASSVVDRLNSRSTSQSSSDVRVRCSVASHALASSWLDNAVSLLGYSALIAFAKVVGCLGQHVSSLVDTYWFVRSAVPVLLSSVWLFENPGYLPLSIL